MFRQFSRAAVANLIHLEGQIYLTEHHQGPHQCFFHKSGQGVLPSPQIKSVTNREKTTAFKPMCLNFTLHQ
jgi:hypothetical protein